MLGKDRNCGAVMPESLNTVRCILHLYVKTQKDNTKRSKKSFLVAQNVSVNYMVPTVIIRVFKWGTMSVEKIFFIYSMKNLNNMVMT